MPKTILTTSWLAAAVLATDAARPIHGPRTTSATEASAAELMCLPMGFPATRSPWWVTPTADPTNTRCGSQRSSSPTERR